MKYFLWVVLALGLVSCMGTKPLRPGQVNIKSSSLPNGTPAFAADLKQSENPAQGAQQNFERTTETELPIPAQSKVVEMLSAAAKTAGAESMTREKTVILSEPTIQKTRTVEKVGTIIGAAQKDTARELGAKLASLKGIVWIGVGLFVFGLASLVWPPLKMVIGSVTTSAAIMAGGLALMVLPTMIVGNEMLILGGVVLAVGAWFLAHRHGHVRGIVETQKQAQAAEQ